MSKIAVSAAVLLLAALPANALAQDNTRAYATLGYSQMDTDQASLGMVTARAGYNLQSGFGIEAEASVGVDDDAFDVSIGGPGVIKHKHDFSAYFVGLLPVGERVELFARVGFGVTSVESSAPGVIARGDGESFNYGLGSHFFIDDRNGLRADWTRRDFTGDAGEADVWSLSYIRRF